MAKGMRKKEAFHLTDQAGTAPAPGAAPVPHTASQKGGAGPLEKLYRQYAAELVKYIHKTFGAGPPDPEDVVQAAFVRYANMAAPEKVQNSRAFLYATARNIILDHKRYDKRTEAFIDDVIRDAEQNLDKITPEDVSLQREQFEIMVSVIKKLPRKQGIILTMNRLHGKTYTEISRETGWSLGDISRQLNAGLGAIEDALLRANGGKGEGQ